MSVLHKSFHKVPYCCKLQNSPYNEVKWKYFIPLSRLKKENSFSEATEYIDNLLKITGKLHSRVFRAQDNIKNIMDRMYSWAMLPVLYRKDARDEQLLAIAEKDERFKERFVEIEETATELDRILRENYKLFFDLLPDNVYEKDEAELLDGEFFVHMS